MSDKIKSSREEISKRIRDQGKQMQERQKLLEEIVASKETATTSSSVQVQVGEMEGTPSTSTSTDLGEIPPEDRMRLIVSEAKSTLLRKMDAFERKDEEYGKEMKKVKDAVARQGQMLEEVQRRVEEAAEESRQQNSDIKRALQQLTQQAPQE